MLKADKKIVITFVVMILVACTAFCGYSYINNPKRKMNQLLEEQDYAEAITCYNETIKASKYEEEFNSVLIALIESTTDEWETEIISYEEAIYALEKFSMINNPSISGLVQEKISHIKIETEGDKLLTKAKESFEKAKHIETLQALLTIDSNYSQYESVLELKKNNKEEFLLTVSSPETVRDLTYDLTHWGESDYFVANLTTDVVALLPVAGVIKYASHFTDFAKNTDNVADLVDSVADLSNEGYREITFRRALNDLLWTKLSCEGEPQSPKQIIFVREEDKKYAN